MGGSNFVTVGAVPDAQNDGVSVSPINVLSATPVTVVAAVTGKRIFVHGLHADAAASVTLAIQDVSASSTVVLNGAAMVMEPGQHLVLPWQNYPWYTCASGDALVFSTGASVQVSGRIMYVQG